MTSAEIGVPIRLPRPSRTAPAVDMLDLTLRYAVERNHDATVVRIAGGVDLASAPELRTVVIDVLSESPDTHLVVDLSGCQFIDSTGIGVLVGAYQRAIAKGGRFSVVVATPAVQKVLQITGLLRAWRVTESVEDALSV